MLFVGFTFRFWLERGHQCTQKAIISHNPAADPQPEVPIITAALQAGPKDYFDS